MNLNLVKLDIDEKPAPPSVYLPYELLAAMEDFKVGEREVKGLDDCFYPVTYAGSRCRIQTPELFIVHGLTVHQNPGDKTPRYSTHFSLKNVNREHTDFIELIHKLDVFAMEYRRSQKDKFWSSLRNTNKNKEIDKPPLLRIKIPTTFSGKLLVDIIDEEDNITSLPTEEQFKKLIQHHTKVKAIIEVNPLWYAGEKYGISYRILKLQLVANHSKLAYSLKFR